jgi:hypothetical protein
MIRKRHRDVFAGNHIIDTILPNYMAIARCRGRWSFAAKIGRVKSK